MWQRKQTKMETKTEKTISLSEIRKSILKHKDDLERWGMLQDTEPKTRLIGMWHLLERLEDQ
jgi:hypothetical protein